MWSRNIFPKLLIVTENYWNFFQDARVLQVLVFPVKFAAGTRIWWLKRQLSGSVHPVNPLRQSFAKLLRCSIPNTGVVRHKIPSWPWGLAPEASGGEQGCVIFLGFQVDFFICFAERWFLSAKERVTGDRWWFPGGVNGKPFLPTYPPPDWTVESSKIKGVYRMRRSYSCSVFHDKPTVAVQRVHTALYQGISWCSCKYREFETECAKKSYWGLWRRINLVSSHCVDGEYPGQCSHFL